jgi:hypothetical protein
MRQHVWVLIPYYGYEGFDKPKAVYPEFPTYKQLREHKVSKELYERMFKAQDYDVPYDKNVDGLCLLKMTLNGSK